MPIQPSIGMTAYQRQRSVEHQVQTMDVRGRSNEYGTTFCAGRFEKCARNLLICRRVDMTETGANFRARFRTRRIRVNLFFAAGFERVPRGVAESEESVELGGALQPAAAVYDHTFAIDVIRLDAQQVGGEI